MDIKSQNACVAYIETRYFICNLDDFNFKKTISGISGGLFDSKILFK